jgi:hypothetical protein
MVLTCLIDAVAASQDGWTATDWIEIILADADLLSDILFAVEVKQKSNECMSYKSNDCSALFQIFVASVTFIVLPLTAGMLWNISLSLNDIDGQGIMRFYNKIDGWIAWMKTPPIFLIYLFCHLCNFIVLSSSMERLSKIAIERGQTRRRLFLNCIGFVLESIPQLACQIAFLLKSGPTTFTIISMTITSYKIVSSFSFKIYLALFRVNFVALRCT